MMFSVANKTSPRAREASRLEIDQSRLYSICVNVSSLFAVGYECNSYDGECRALNRVGFQYHSQLFSP